VRPACYWPGNAVPIVLGTDLSGTPSAILSEALLSLSHKQSFFCQRSLMSQLIYDSKRSLVLARKSEKRSSFAHYEVDD
jgi:hypothetical protein